MEWTYYDEENFIKLNVNTGGILFKIIKGVD